MFRRSDVVLPELVVKPSFYVFWLIFCLLDSGHTILYFLAAALIHELGHAAAIALSGSRIERIELYAAGVCMSVSRTKSYRADLAIAAAGPAAGIAAAMLFANAGMTELAGANILLSVFNLLIIYPLDGACMAVAVLCMSPLGLCGVDVLRVISLIESALLLALGAALWHHTRTNPTVFCIGLMLLAGNLKYSCEKV